jgi:hypothetical protein
MSEIIKKEKECYENGITIQSEEVKFDTRQELEEYRKKFWERFWKKSEKNKCDK